MTQRVWATEIKSPEVLADLQSQTHKPKLTFKKIFFKMVDGSSSVFFKKKIK
jgi:hypothetical protein